MSASTSFLIYLTAAAACMTCVCLGVELTFELPDNAKECFYEDIEKGTPANVEFQVRVSFLIISTVT